MRSPFSLRLPVASMGASLQVRVQAEDFDAGQLIHGKAMPQLLSEFVDTIVEFASGRQTCNEKNDFRELAIFKSGVTL